MYATASGASLRTFTRDYRVNGNTLHALQVVLRPDPLLESYEVVSLGFLVTLLI